MRSKLVTLLLAGGLTITGGTAGVIAAGDPDPDGKSAAKTQYVEKAKCNSGNGNKSESTAVDATGHCTMGDPGNSYNADNKGGDEAETGTQNPGGNNHFSGRP